MARVETFGCRLNAAESETIRRLAADTDDLAVVNTCAVTAEAVRQARQTVRRLARETPAARIVVTGCAAQVDPAAFARMPEVARVVGNAEKLAPETWEAMRGPAPAARVAVADIMTQAAPPRPAASPGRVRAFVSAQNGCDHRCTFCVIPFGRGRSRSAPPEAVVAEVRRLVEEGVREVVLTGVDLTAYGADLAPATRLGGLVKTVLAEVPALARLRLSSIDSVEADPDLLDALGQEPRLMPHLHLSLQAGDDLILKRMRRRHSRADAIRFCRDARRRRPDLVLGADLIAGFPTETDAMFARTLDLVAECGLTHLHVFPFSPRPGTPAARMPPVPPTQARERARRLRDAGAAALLAHLEAQVGRTLPVLMETERLGRTEGFSAVRFERPLAAGRLAEAAIKGHDGRELLAG